MRIDIIGSIFQCRLSIFWVDLRTIVINNLYDLIDSYIWLRISLRIFLSWSYLSLLWLSYLYFFWYDILFLFYLYWFLSYDCCLLENCVRFLFEFIWGCTILREQNDFLCLPHILLWGFINSPPFSWWLHSQNTGIDRHSHFV